MNDYIRLLRPSNWSKNVFVFVPLVFSGKLLGEVRQVLWAVLAAVLGFVCLSLASSAVYAFNDIIDREADKLHPQKRSRPIAAGRISVGQAGILSAVLGAVAILSSFLIARWLGLVVLAYIVLMILYSVALKRLIILDVIVVATGFCLRAVAGAVVVAVDISPWLIICTFALCLFLGFGKRRGEIALLGENGEAFRQTLGGYTPELLGHMVDVTSGLAIVCFLLYAMDDRTEAIFGTNSLVYTTPFVLFCVFRFSALMQKGQYSDPVRLILADRPFQISLALWALLCAWIIYGANLGIGLSDLAS